jgi:hypothetical protein
VEDLEHVLAGRDLDARARGAAVDGDVGASLGRDVNDRRLGLELELDQL